MQARLDHTTPEAPRGRGRIPCNGGVIPCNIRREGGESLEMVGGSSLVILEGGFAFAVGAPELVSRMCVVSGDTLVAVACRSTQEDTQDSRLASRSAPSRSAPLPDGLGHGSPCSSVKWPGPWHQHQHRALPPAQPAQAVSRRGGTRRGWGGQETGVTRRGGRAHGRAVDD